MNVPSEIPRTIAADSGQYAHSTPPSAVAANGTPQRPGQTQPLTLTSAPQPTGVVPAKSPGVAVLLSILWLGAGQLYAGRNTSLGIALIILDFFLYLITALTAGLGLIITFPIWLVAAFIAATLASNAANEFNRRNGIVVR